MARGLENQPQIRLQGQVLLSALLQVILGRLEFELGRLFSLRESTYSYNSI